MEFMEEIGSISTKVYQEDGIATGFYAKRGLQVNNMEISSYTCTEKKTSEVLQQILQEGTHRTNRLSQQASLNEVKDFEIQGNIEHGKLSIELDRLRHEQME